jgi:hypothetical protein
MALSFPLARGTFWAGLKIAEARPSLPDERELYRTAGGEVITAELGARLWRGVATLAPMRAAEAEAALAVIRVLNQSGRSFHASPAGHDMPTNDPAGLMLGASTVTIASLPAGNRELALTGLPAGFALAVGDYLSFAYGANPTRYALHQVVNSATADATGLTPAFEVVPNIRPGAAVGTAVTLLHPSFKAVIVPGSVQEGRLARTLRKGISFAWQQTLR